jgi:GxxExxY protein
LHVRTKHPARPDRSRDRRCRVRGAQRAGPGLLESVYEPCLSYELETRHLAVQRQVELPVFYRDLRLDAGFRMDMVVDGLVVVEIKATERLLPVHEAQLLTYLKLSGHKLGLLINFNVTLIKLGIRRLIAKP